MLWPNDFVVNGHKIVFTGAHLVKGAGAAAFEKDSQLTWDGKPLVFDGNEWVEP